ncbi:MAG: DUF962 domain-containing protein, partial [Bdellovibrionales bacterium]|nr:DUF962 domain-containing protein [Bdellovibrionales bacterium]
MQSTLLHPRMRERFREYESYHLDVINQRLHYLGVPMIMLGIFGLLVLLPIGVKANGALALWFFSSVYYVWTARRLGVLFSALVFLVYLMALRLSLSISILFFLTGWIIQ